MQLIFPRLRRGRNSVSNFLCTGGFKKVRWVNLGLVKSVFKGDLQLSGVVPAERYTLSGKGKGGVLGLAAGSADIVLTDDGDATELNFSARGAASPRIMQFGTAILGDRAQKVIDGFFARFGEAMGAEVTPLPRD